MQQVGRACIVEIWWSCEVESSTRPDGVQQAKACLEMKTALGFL